jgi:hypothetical protein
MFIRLLNLIISLIILLITSCVQKQEGSSFETLGRIPDGAITFSYSASTGNSSFVNTVMVINPSSLSVVNGIITNCKIKPGTNSLPIGFTINPSTCQVIGSSSSYLPSTSYTIEATSNKGKTASATLTLRIKSLFTFNGVVKGLSAGQSVVISHGTGSSKPIEYNSFNSEPQYSLQGLYDGDTFTMTTTSSDSNSFQCSANSTSGVITGNLVNDIQCYSAGNRTLSYSIARNDTVSGSDPALSVSVRAVFKDSSNTNVISTQDYTDKGIGSYTFNSVPVNSNFTFSVLGNSSGYNCILTPSGSTQLTSNVNDIIINCGLLGPYPVNVTVSGINSGTISFSNNSTDVISNKTNGTYTFANQLNYGQNYNLLITSLPTEHDCTLSSSTGTVIGITNVNIVCTPRSKTLGGSYSGIDIAATETVQLEVASLNGTNTKTLNGVTGGASTSFSFDNSLKYGQSYDVKILSQPSNKICTITNGSGQILGNVNTISVACSVRAIGDCSFGKIVPWSPNSTVRSMACDGQYLYLGGDFTAFGPTSSNTALISTGVAHPVPDSRMPDLTGASKVLSDGSGGWYVKLGSEIKHLKADLSVDSNFSYSMGSYGITDFAIDGDYLFVTTTRSGSHLVKRNRFTGQAVSGFTNPTTGVYSSSKVQVYGNHVYILGRFNTVNSVTRVGIARLDKTTGLLDTSFSPTLSTNPEQTSYAFTYYYVEVIDDKIYVSGSFSYVNGTARASFARINLDGTLDSFIKKIGQYFYLGGAFSSISGQSTQKYLVKYTLSDDTLTSTGLAVNSSVRSIEYDSTNNLLLVGGDFTTATDSNGTVSRKYLASYNLTNNLLTSLAPDLNNSATSIANYSGKIFITGNFSQVYSYPINYFARMKLSDGSLDQSFTPNIGGSVYSLLYDESSSSIMLGGSFLNAFNSDKYVTKIDLTTGNKKAGFTPGNFNSSITKLHKKNDSVFAIGNFTTFDALSMKYLAKFSFIDGAKDPSFVDTQANNSIIDIDSDDNSLFIGGSFSSLQGNTTDAKLIAALDFNGYLKVNFFNNYPTTFYFLKYWNNNLLVNGNYADYNSNGYSEAGAKYSLTSNTGSVVLNYSQNFASTGSFVILSNSSSYKFDSGVIYSLNLTDGSQSTYLDPTYSSGTLFGINNNLFCVDNYFRLLSIK